MNLLLLISSSTHSSSFSQLQEKIDFPLGPLSCQENLLVMISPVTQSSSFNHLEEEGVNDSENNALCKDSVVKYISPSHCTSSRHLREERFMHVSTKGLSKKMLVLCKWVNGIARACNCCPPCAPVKWCMGPVKVHNLIAAGVVVHRAVATQDLAWPVDPLPSFCMITQHDHAALS